MKGCENNGQFYSLSSVGGYKKMKTVFRVRFPLTNRKAAKKKERNPAIKVKAMEKIISIHCAISPYICEISTNSFTSVQRA